MPRIITCRYLSAVAVVALGASFQFYNENSLNTLQPTVQPWIARTWEKRGLKISENTLTYLWSLLTASVGIGGLISVFLQSYSAELIGRRNSLIMGGWLAAAGGLMLASAKWSEMPELLFLGRIAMGMDVGLSSGLAPMYLTEISPVPLRGAAGTAHMICIALGDFLSMLVGVPQLLGTDDLWPIAVSLPGLLAFTLCVCLPWLPKSPRYLLLKADDQPAAQDALQQLVVADHVQTSMAEIVREAAFTKSHSSHERKGVFGSGGVTDLFRKRYLRLPLGIAILAMFGQFTGSVAVFFYSTNIFLNANMEPDTARWCTVLIGFAYFLLVLPSAYFIERFGRRPLVLFQLAGCFVCLSVLSLSFALHNWNPTLLWPTYMSVAALVVYMCVYGVGASIPWLIASELFAQKYRSSAVFVASFTSVALSLFTALAYLPFEARVGIPLSFLPFIVGLFFAFIGMYLLLPETRNRSIEDIVREFRLRARTVTFNHLPLDDASVESEIRHLLGESSSSGSLRRRSNDADVNSGYGSIAAGNSLINEANVISPIWSRDRIV